MLVEGVTILAGLLSGYRVNIARERKGEMVIQYVKDCDIQLSLKIRDRKRVGASIARVIS
jgi:hypothetical protein